MKNSKLTVNVNQLSVSNIERDPNTDQYFVILQTHGHDELVIVIKSKNPLFLNVEKAYQSQYEAEQQRGAA